MPQLPARGGPIPGLRLRLIQDEHDPAHRLWNRLIAREHPLRRRPLVGAQLRYLIECEAGILGAFGFGPAAYHLACRDSWIGWSPAARQRHLPRVLGLSRFLLRPGLRVPNLASRCYRLVLRQVAQDWHQRYGIQPVLVETYVDRQQHPGHSLAAANWRRLGQSQGRGRDDRQRQRAQSTKDVWAYELTPDARAQLQAVPVEPLAPRSVFAPLEADWAQEEMAGVQLGDARLNRRVVELLRGRWARPQSSFYRSFASARQAKRAYELVENPRAQIDLPSLLAPHTLQTAQRMAAEAVVLLAQDTCTLSYNTLHQTQGLGPIEEADTRGLFLHSLQAFRLDGIPLGTAWAQVWARPADSDTAQRNEQSCDEKESGRWLRALQAANQWARQMPQTQVVVCGDREADIYELYDQKQGAPANVHVLVRGQHERSLSDGPSLQETVARRPVGGRMVVQVPRRLGRPARTATLELRWQAVELQPPAVARKKSWPPLTVYALWAREVGAPAGVPAISWWLLTTWAVGSLKMARRLVRWYALRWGIECFHQVLKMVCGVERRQMKTARALERALALDLIVAGRVLLLSRLGKAHPELPAEVGYTAEELAVLEVKKKTAANTPPAHG
ncbi:MAG: IS4 family transposase [Terriglobales bacterium]